MKIVKILTLIGYAFVAILAISAFASAGQYENDLCLFENRFGFSPAPQPEVEKAAKGTYQAHVIVYIVEKDATGRYNYNDNSYLTYAFLDMPYNVGVDLDYLETLVDTVLWTGSSNGFGDILEENIMAVVAVYNDSGYTQNSTPGYPYRAFTAHNVDATAGADVHRNWPNKRTEDFTHSVLVEDATEDW